MLTLKSQQTDLLILDDFGMKVLNGQQLDFMEIVEERHAKKSTIIISQLPVAGGFQITQFFIRNG